MIGLAMIGLSNVAPGSAGAPAPYPGARNPVKPARGAGFSPGQPMGAKQARIQPVGPPLGPTGLASGSDRWLIGPPGGKPLQLAFGESFVRYMAFGSAIQRMTAGTRIPATRPAGSTYS
jgi:hypothetical protein